MGHSSYDPVEQGPAWNAGKKLGAKRPLKPKEIWEIRFMLDREHRLRDRALCEILAAAHPQLGPEFGLGGEAGQLAYRLKGDSGSKRRHRRKFRRRGPADGPPIFSR